jgi:hypothetical protein
MVKPGYREYYVTVDSTDRDRTVWPSSSQFQVKMEPSPTFQGATLSRAFKNVKSVEIINVIYPNTNNVVNDMYLYLCVPELEGSIETTANFGKSAVAQLLPTKVVGNFVYSIYHEDMHPKNYYPVEGTRIDKLTLEFRRKDGTLFDFGTDTTHGNSPNKLVQTSATFRIVVRDRLIP